MDHNGTQKDRDSDEGNTSLSRGPLAKYWCFTLNNWTMDQKDHIIKKCDEKKIEYIFGEEIAPTTNTKHLQGFISCKTRIRASEYFKLKEIHWETCKGNKEQNIEYCSKMDKFHTNMKLIIDPMKDRTFYKWQDELIKIITEKPDDRTINWLWEPVGKSGKSSFSKHLCLKYKAIYVNGKGHDVKSAIVSYNEKHDRFPEIVIWGVPRDMKNYISYGTIEEIKDGLFFSGKFESSMAIFNSPHLIVFANFEPEYEKFSYDRWNVINISGPHPPTQAVEIIC